MTAIHRHIRRSHVAIAALLAAVATPSESWGDTAIPRADSRCEVGRIKIIDATPSEAIDICEALTEVVRYFGALGFRIDPSISVMVQPRSAAEATVRASAHGYFRPGNGKIVVFRSPQIAAWGVEWGSDIATSFLRHEFVHAAVWHILQGDGGRFRREWHEFIAYSIQIALMDHRLRARVLARYPDAEHFADLMAVNEFTYGTDPERFAVSAYQTYVAHGGPRFIDGLLRFQIVPPPMSYPFPVLPEQIPELEVQRAPGVAP